MGEGIQEKQTLPERVKCMKNVSITIAVLAMLVAAAGLAVGVYGITQFQELTRKMEVSVDKGKTPMPTAGVDCVDVVETEGEEATDCVVPAEEAEKDLLIADSDYVYIGEWGVKIHVPEGAFWMMSYKYDGGRNAVVFNAVASEMSAVPKFYEEDQGLVVVSRIAKSEAGEGIVKVFEDGEYVYQLSNIQATYSTNSNEQKVETDSMNKLKEILGSKENYSKF